MGWIITSNVTEPEGSSSRVRNGKQITIKCVFAATDEDSEYRLTGSWSAGSDGGQDETSATKSLPAAGGSRHFYLNGVPQSVPAESLSLTFEIEEGSK